MATYYSYSRTCTHLQNNSCCISRKRALRTDDSLTVGCCISQACDPSLEAIWLALDGLPTLWRESACWRAVLDLATTADTTPRHQCFVFKRAEMHDIQLLAGTSCVQAIVWPLLVTVERSLSGGQSEPHQQQFQGRIQQPMQPELQMAAAAREATHRHQPLHAPQQQHSHRWQQQRRALLLG